MTASAAPGTPLRRATVPFWESLPGQRPSMPRRATSPQPQPGRKVRPPPEMDQWLP